MKSPRERRQLRTREHILNVARDMVLHQGHEKLSLRAVAKAADYSPSGLYEYFSSKEELMEMLAKRSGALLSEALQKAAGGKAPLQSLCLAYIKFALENPEEFQLLFSRTSSKRTHLKEKVTGPNPYAIVLEQVQRAQNLGETRSDLDAETISYALWSLVHGIATLRLTHLKGFQADFITADAAAVSALLAGFGGNTSGTTP